LDRCPLRTLQLARAEVVEEMDRYVDRYYPAYQDGHLLVAGGIADQPARYLDWMEQIARVDQAAKDKYHELTAEQRPSTDEGA
jgi:hypothetical protein